MRLDSRMCSCQGSKMGWFIALTLHLCAFTAFGQDFDEFLTFAGDSVGLAEYESYYYTTDSPAEETDLNNGDWLFELLDVSDQCNPNPCLNGGVCSVGPNGKFVCSCPELYSGKKCQRVKDVCKKVKCGHGSCTVTSTPPFYECKCKPPYRPPACKKASPCSPDPCQNSGTCMKGRKRPSFHCSCPEGYSGTFCEVGPNDCYEEDGESYRGLVSMTGKDEECLDWNSYFILKNGINPFQEYAGFDGIGPHNYCRNPDGDSQPWCFIKQKNRPKWRHCKIRKCASAPPTTPPIYPTADNSQFSQCGRPQPRSSVRIFGGKKSLPGAHPWQASLQIRSKNSPESFRHICGGVLIGSCWVLTAAHCIKTGVEMQVVLGGVDIEEDETYDQTIQVERAIVHDQYRESLFALHNDIALLQLKATNRPYCAKETPFVRTACLPNQAFSNGTECTVSGWGVTETQHYGTNQLMDARVLLISQVKCKAPHVYGDSLDDSMFCAGNINGGIDSCQGDSGGPLVCQSNGAHSIVGLVSWGDGCGKAYKPGVYTNVIKFNHWINSLISGGRPSP